MDYYAFGKSFVENKIKELPYVKDYHVQRIDGNISRSAVTKFATKLKVRVWIYENSYLAEVILGNPKIEEIMKDLQKVQPISYDVFYV
jgi:hypothetical protein